MSNCDRKYIYRYMNYNEFLDILRFNRLTLRYPGQWPDKFEMLFLKCFENETELNRLSSTYQISDLDCDCVDGDCSTDGYES